MFDVMDYIVFAAGIVFIGVVMFWGDAESLVWMW